jgi:hypothetical protein
LNSIRQVAASTNAARVALAERERTVSIWDVDPARHIATFPTVLDFGGVRIGLSSDGETLVCAAYRREGVAAYSSASGELLWQRRDIKRPQRISMSHRHRAVYVGFDDGPCLALSLDDGIVAQRLRGVRWVVESSFAPLLFLDQHRPVVATPDLKPLFAVHRTTFAFLDVAFGPNHVAVAEAGGPVTCIDIASGRSTWTFAPPNGVHCLCLAYCAQLQAFVGVLWPFVNGGPKKLVVFDQRGGASVIKDLGEPFEECFCQGGSALLTAQGSLIHVTTGRETPLVDAPA